MGNKTIVVMVTAFILYATITITAMAASVVGSKHDISANSSEQPCVYCHTPHFASATIAAPLWNRRITNLDAYVMYASPTIDASIASRPSGISLACLSCHDGVSSKGAASAVNSFDTHNMINKAGSGMGTNSYNGKCASCHSGTHGSYSQILQIGADLTNDHPISMTYPTAAQDPAFFVPPDLQKGWSDVPLFGGKVECPSCHNVHDPARSPFLRVANSGSALCYKCHNK